MKCSVEGEKVLLIIYTLGLEKAMVEIYWLVEDIL